MKNILVISNMFPSSNDPYYGSFVKISYDYIKNSGNVNCKLIAIKGKPKNIFSKVKSYVIFYSSIIKSVLINNYDLIYVHTISHTSIPLRMCSFVRKLNLVFNIHGTDLLSQKTYARLLRKISVPLLLKSKNIIVPSDLFSNKLLNFVPDLYKNKIIISPSGGISKEFFHRGNEMEESRIPLIGYVSRIDRGKGWDVFIRALQILQNEGVDFKAELIGRGKEAEMLESSISKLKLKEKVRFLGPKSHTELKDIYQTFDLFVFPTTLFESLGLVGIEAMASSVPVIGSHIGGLTTYIKDGINGYFFTPGDADSLADKIKTYFSLSKDERIKMKEEAFATANEYESEKVNTKLLEEIGILT